MGDNYRADRFFFFVVFLFLFSYQSPVAPPTTRVVCFILFVDGHIILAAPYVGHGEVIMEAAAWGVWFPALVDSCHILFHTCRHCSAGLGLVFSPAYLVPNNIDAYASRVPAPIQSFPCFPFRSLVSQTLNGFQSRI